MTQEVNVKVALRVRPILPREKLGGQVSCMRVNGVSNEVIIGRDRAFIFDYAFGPNATQGQLYQKCVEELVDFCFSGYNSTVFAYGQTASGKTHTISGDVRNSEHSGIISRSVAYLFKLIASCKVNRSVEVRVSFVEIYKEELRDILNLNTATNKDLNIREDDRGNTVIAGLQDVVCNTPEQVLSLLEQGSAVRQTGPTLVNLTSSRSHAIFTISIDQQWSSDDETPPDVTSSCDTNEATKCCTSSKFHFVDLAGSERVYKTGNVGERFKESVFINSGLLALGNVIAALADPKRRLGHIPYRDSKLTRLLRDSLGGNARTLMICCVSPSIGDYDESLNSVKYASRARHIKNRPVVNRDPYTLRYEAMKTEIQALREELQLHREGASLPATQAVNTTVTVDGSDQGFPARDLHARIESLQTQCLQYKELTSAAYGHILEIKGRDVLSQSLVGGVDKWMLTAEGLRQSWSCEDADISHLQTELCKCKERLRSDEKLSAEKSKMISELQVTVQRMQDENEMLTQDLGRVKSEKHDIEECLVSQRLLIEELQNKANLEGAIDSLNLQAEDSIDLSRKDHVNQRAKSVPAHRNRRLNSSTSLQNGQLPSSRQIHSSPAILPVDRFMQSFRARSDLLLTSIEDCDQVLTPILMGRRHSSSSEQNPSAEKSEAYKQKSHSSAKVSRNDTYTKSKSKRKDTDSEDLKQTIKVIKDEKLDRRRQVVEQSLQESNAQVTEIESKLQDLTLNIKLKEQLIRELVKSEKDADLINKDMRSRIVSFEAERKAMEGRLCELEISLCQVADREQSDLAERKKLESVYKQKIDAAKNTIQELQKKQKETGEMLAITGQNEKKVHDMELAIASMKQQHDNLKSSLKLQVDTKLKLEKELQKEQNRIKDLQLKNERQQNVLKRKTEELAVANRKLRGINSPVVSDVDKARFEQQQKWLDQQIEQVLEQKENLAQLGAEVQQRTQSVEKRELLLVERSQLQAKAGSLPLRPEQTLGTTEMVSFDKSNGLRDTRGHLNEQRSALCNKMEAGGLLTAQEERRLIELDEAVEAVNEAISFQSESIRHCETEVRNSLHFITGDTNPLTKLSSLTLQELRKLFHNCFEKVVDLKKAVNDFTLKEQEHEVNQAEHQRLVKSLQNALDRVAAEKDRQMLALQQQYEHKLQVMMREVTGSRSTLGPEQRSSVAVNGDLCFDLRNRVHELEKELFYYKMTSRDLKRKLHDAYQQQRTGDTASRGLQQPPKSAPPSNAVTSNTEDQTYTGSTNLERLPTPVRLMRKDVRQISEADVSIRRSSLLTAAGDDVSKPHT